MRITDLLDRRSVSLTAAPKTKSETLDMAVDLMVKSEKISDREAYRKQVYLREEESTTGVRGADMCPLYMYYEGDLYIPAVNPEDRLIFDTAELKDYKYVGKTTQCSDCSGLTENFRVTILRDNAKVYYDQNEPLDGKPFALMSINENGTVWIAYLKLNDRD